MRATLGARHLRGWVVALTYTVPVAIVSLATLTWFTPGRFVAGGNVGPFYRGRAIANATSLWGYSSTGEGSPMAEAPRFAEGAVTNIVGWFGGGPELGQQVFLAACLALAAGGLTFCFRQILRGNLIAPPLAALLGVANPGVLSQLPDPLVPATLGATGVLAGVIIRAARKPVPMGAFIVASLPLAYVALEPASLLVVGVGCAFAFGAAAVLDGGAGLRCAGSSALRSLPVITVLHAWWIVPLSITAATAGGRLGSNTVPWADSNASVVNVLTMTSHWAWNLHLPWTQHFSEWPLVATRWLFPVVAFAAPLAAATRRSRNLALWTLGATVPLVFFTNPGSTSGLLLVLCFASNSGITLHGMLARASRWTTSRMSLRFAAVYLAVGIGWTGFPLFTGDLAPSGDDGALVRSVAVPAAWEGLGAALDADPTQGKVLVLPNADYHQMSTTWGYHGTSDLLRHLTLRPVLVSLPGSRDDVSPAVATMLADVEARLELGDERDVQGLLDNLGVSHVVVRNDFGPQVVSENPTDARALREGLESSGLFARAVDHGRVATVFRRTRAPRAVQVSARNGTAADTSMQPLVRVRGRSTGSYDVTIAPVPGRELILAIDDSADPGWRLHGLPAGAKAEPITVEGSRQGWIVRSPETFEASIRYSYTSWLRLGQLVSIVCALLLVYLLATAAQERRGRSRWDYLPALRRHLEEARHPNGLEAEPVEPAPEVEIPLLEEVVSVAPAPLAIPEEERVYEGLDELAAAMELLEAQRRTQGNGRQSIPRPPSLTVGRS